MINEKKFTFGIIGCGNIGNAIAQGLIKYAGISAGKICASEVDRSKAASFRKKFGIHITDNQTLARNSKFIIVAVKPKDVPEVCGSISPFLKDNSVVISVAAGITIDSIKKMSGKNTPVIRFMPNLGIGYGKGLIGYCSKNVKKIDLKRIINIFSKTGFCFPVKEKDMFFITALAGSGPGFLFYLAEIMYDLLKTRGFPEQTTIKIISGLFEAAGVMLSTSKEKPVSLKEKVCSPGGTTLAGLSKLMENNLQNIINAAFDAAEKRARDLSKQT